MRVCDSRHRKECPLSLLTFFRIKKCNFIRKYMSFSSGKRNCPLKTSFRIISGVRRAELHTCIPECYTISGWGQTIQSFLNDCIPVKC